MNRTTKKRLMVLAIILTFAFSSIAFIVTGITGSVTQQEFKPLESVVVDGEVDSYTESVYVQKGYTFLKFYYTDSAPQYINDLPSTMATTNGETQLIVVRVQSTENFAAISNLNGAVEVKNTTQENIVDALCKSLMVTPVECTFINFQNQPDLAV
ncbi:MAG: hypothetical protein HYU56_05545 [Candidatus Aenigmarchaeota archaeon]|nr:hypothetical protein [Candidatus Aenigmarchaeota archaeon]